MNQMMFGVKVYDYFHPEPLFSWEAQVWPYCASTTKRFYAVGKRLVPPSLCRAPTQPLTGGLSQDPVPPLHDPVIKGLTLHAGGLCPHFWLMGTCATQLSDKYFSVAPICPH